MSDSYIKICNAVGDVENSLMALKCLEQLLADQSGDIEITPSKLYYLISTINTDLENKFNQSKAAINEAFGRK